jgi:hypothetical protein
LTGKLAPIQKRQARNGRYSRPMKFAIATTTAIPIFRRRAISA